MLLSVFAAVICVDLLLAVAAVGANVVAFVSAGGVNVVYFSCR